VCEQQSISRTADVERIAASAVSKRMSDLEAMVKTPLFLRSQKGLDMTPAAHDLLKHARIVLRDLGQLENDMLDHSKGRRGDVRPARLAILRSPSTFPAIWPISWG